MFRNVPAAIEPRLIAPCGMNCALCLAYQRPKNRCPGCRDDDNGKPSSCRQCIIKNCETIKKAPSHLCYECEKTPCRRLKQLDARYRAKYHMSMLENLKEIKEQGMEPFLSHQGERYSCAKCQGLICVHRDRCLSCDP